MQAGKIGRDGARAAPIRLSARSASDIRAGISKKDLYNLQAAEQRQAEMLLAREGNRDTSEDSRHIGREDAGRSEAEQRTSGGDEPWATQWEGAANNLDVPADEPNTATVEDSQSSTPFGQFAHLPPSNPAPLQPPSQLYERLKPSSTLTLYGGGLLLGGWSHPDRDRTVIRNCVYLAKYLDVAGCRRLLAQQQPHYFNQAGDLLARSGLQGYIVEQLGEHPRTDSYIFDPRFWVCMLYTPLATGEVPEGLMDLAPPGMLLSIDGSNHKPTTPTPAATYGFDPQQGAVTRHSPPGLAVDHNLPTNAYGAEASIASNTRVEAALQMPPQQHSEPPVPQCQSATMCRQETDGGEELYQQFPDRSIARQIMSPPRRKKHRTGQQPKNRCRTTNIPFVPDQPSKLRQVYTAQSPAPSSENIGLTQPQDVARVPSTTPPSQKSTPGRASLAQASRPARTNIGRLHLDLLRRGYVKEVHQSTDGQDGESDEDNITVATRRHL